MQRLFAELLLLNQQACSSIRLTESFGWQSNEVRLRAYSLQHKQMSSLFFKAINHQDVHELNRLLFDAIHKSLQGTKQSNLIRSCYEGSIMNYTECKQCQKIFKRSVNKQLQLQNSMYCFCFFKEDYQDLSLVVQDSPNLSVSLTNMFINREQLIGDNQYRCSECKNQLCDAEKVSEFNSLI